VDLYVRVYRTLCLAVVAALVASSAPARADVYTEPTDTTPERERPDPDWQIPIMVLEHAAIIIPPTIYYWSTVSDQMEDWELRWDWKSWHEKLFSTNALVLDTNRFMPNAVRHPFTGALSYQVGRANGLGPWASLAIDFATSVFWEYFVEYREMPSINDIATNTLGGILIGEPLFQLAAVGEGRSTPYRRALSWIASPFHRAQSEVGLSWLPRALEPAAELKLQLAPSYARFAPGATRPEFAAGVDLWFTRDSAFALAGQGTTTTGLAGWNREILDLRFGQAPDTSGVTGARFRSETSYWARYDRDLDELGTGDARAYALGGGIELSDRRLNGSWDKLGVFELVGPSVQVFRRTRAVAIDGQLGAYADVAMVEAHVFPTVPDTARSVLLSRGYYYATGASAIARVRVRGERWSSSVDATAHQFWSFDDHSYGGTMDPHGVADQRLITTARFGVKPTDSDLTVEAFGDAIVRRGTWSTMTRTDGELDAGLGLTVGF
jgi:hypothetical protein